MDSENDEEHEETMRTLLRDSIWCEMCAENKENKSKKRYLRFSPHTFYQLYWAAVGFQHFPIRQA